VGIGSFLILIRFSGRRQRENDCIDITVFVWEKKELKP